MKYPRAGEPLPAALPPETRTVGQLIAETVRLYQRRFWAALALGVPPAALTLVGAALPSRLRFVFAPTAGAVALSVSLVAASCIVLERRPAPRQLAIAFACGCVTFVPAPFLTLLFILPAFAWIALVGLSVPAAVAEPLGFVPAIARGTKIARADLAHAIGSVVTLALVAFLTQTVLFFLLRGSGHATLWAASFLAVLVISPLVFLGVALLYLDQAARAGD